MKIEFNTRTAKIQPYYGVNNKKQSVKNSDTLSFTALEGGMEILSDINKASFLGAKQYPQKRLDNYTQKLFDNCDIGFFATPKSYNAIRKVEDARLHTFYDSVQKLTYELVDWFNPKTSEFLEILEEFYKSGTDLENLEYSICSNDGIYTLRTEKNNKQDFLIIEKELDEVNFSSITPCAIFEHNLPQSDMVGCYFEIHMPADDFSSHIKEVIAEYPIQLVGDKYDTEPITAPWRIILIDNYNQRHMLVVNSENKVPRFEFYHRG